MAGDAPAAHVQASARQDAGGVPPPPPNRPPSAVGAATSATARLDDPSFSLRVACLVWIGLWSVGLVMNNVVGPIVSPDQPLDDAFPWPANPIAFACILVSGLLFVLARGQRLSPDRLVDVALAYEVVLAFGIGVVNQWTPNTAGLSWIAVLVLVHPLLVPAPMVRTLIASVAAASMDLVGLAIAGARGVELPPTAAIVWTYLPNYLCAAIAVIPARVRTRMEEHQARSRELGSYQVGELLSRGGMGEVYRAEHRLLARPAAVKLIRSDIFGQAGTGDRDRIVRRFEREARLTARLRSPHTVAVYDYGVTRDGTLFYVMELLDGLDLDQFIRRFGPVPVERAVHLLLQVCDSLAEAHACGLVHRDIKPSNVVLARHGRHADFVKVVDFGLARPFDARRPDVGLTIEATVLGTPGFMAPEQIAGEQGAGPPADLYAVGCLAYWLVTGRQVYDGRRPIEVLADHLHTPPQPPSACTELPVPAAFDAVVLACLEKAPDRRPASADDLIGRLAAVGPLPGWTAERARAWWDSHMGDTGRERGRPA